MRLYSSCDPHSVGLALTLDRSSVAYYLAFTFLWWTWELVWGRRS